MWATAVRGQCHDHEAYKKANATFLSLCERSCSVPYDVRAPVLKQAW